MESKLEGQCEAKLICDQVGAEHGERCIGKAAAVIGKHTFCSLHAGSIINGVRSIDSVLKGYGIGKGVV